MRVTQNAVEGYVTTCQALATHSRKSYGRKFRSNLTGDRLDADVNIGSHVKWNGLSRDTPIILPKDTSESHKGAVHHKGGRKLVRNNGDSSFACPFS